LENNSFAILLTREHAQSTKKLSHVLVALIDSSRYGTGNDPIRIKSRTGLAYLDKDSGDAVHLISEAMFASTEPSNISDSGLMGDSELIMAGELLKEQLLQSALEDEQLLIDYQPMQHPKKGDEVELMQVRIKSPDKRGHYLVHNLLSGMPNESLLSSIDNFTLKAALELIGENRFEGKETTIIVPMSQNMLAHPESTLWLREQLRKMQVVGTGLILSFRLTEASHYLKSAHAAIKTLKLLGAEVCLSFFHGNATHFKIAKALKPNYVAVSSRLLDKADGKTITILARNLNTLQIGLCIYPPEEDQIISDDWIRIADFLPKHL
jgi:EAL domain-containing protein (putative c-di-GMP-specific phosphodiesterase class I)